MGWTLRSTPWHPHLQGMATDPTKKPDPTKPVRKIPRRQGKGPDHHRPFRRGTSGAPTTYEECFCDRVLHAGSYGLSFAQIAHDLGTHRQQIYQWAERHPAFADALVHARDAALAWWEHQGVKGMWAGKEFNDRVMKFMMTNQHRDDYKERVEVSGALARIDFGRLTDEQLAAISAGKHPYEVLAPKREMIGPGPSEQSVAQATIPEEAGGEPAGPAQPPEEVGTSDD